MLILLLHTISLIFLEIRLCQPLQEEWYKFISEEDHPLLKLTSLLLLLLSDTLVLLIMSHSTNSLLLVSIIVMLETLPELCPSVELVPTLMVSQLSHGQKLSSHNSNTHLLNSNTKMPKKKEDVLLRLEELLRLLELTVELSVPLLLNQFHLLETKWLLQAISKLLELWLKMKVFHLLLTKLKPV